MKLIIDIPKSIYEYMQTDKYDRHKTEYFEMIIPHSVKDGTPLEEEFEKIKAEIEEEQKKLIGRSTDFYVGKSNGYTDIWEKIEKHISEMKGENK